MTSGFLECGHFISLSVGVSFDQDRPTFGNSFFLRTGFPMVIAKIFTPFPVLSGWISGAVLGQHRISP
jgi:hypothetical protein